MKNPAGIKAKPRHSGPQAGAGQNFRYPELILKILRVHTDNRSKDLRFQASFTQTHRRESRRFAEIPKICPETKRLQAVLSLHDNQAMATEASNQDALKLIVQLQAAIRTVRLYPPSNPLVQSSISALRNSFDALLKDRDAFVLAESENCLIVDGTPLEEKAQKKDQVLALRGLLQQLGLQSVGFSRGLTDGELRSAVELFGMDAKTFQERPFVEIAAQRKLPHLQFNQKIYVAVDPDRQLLQSLAVKDEEILKFFQAGGQSVAPDREEIRRMAADPRWIAGVFASGLKRIAAQTGPAPSAAFSRGFEDLLKRMDPVLEQHDRQQVAAHLAGEVARTDIDTIFSVAVQDVEKHLGKPFLEALTEQLDTHQFKQLVDRLEHAAHGQRPGDPQESAPSDTSLQTALEALMRSAKGQQFKLKPAHDSAGAVKDGQQGMVSAAEAVKKMRHGDFSALGDPNVLESLPRLVKSLLDGNRDEPAGRLVDTIAHAILHAPPRMHAHLLEIIEKTADGAGIQRHPAAMASLSEHLSTWLKKQYNHTPEVETVCKRLGKLAVDFIHAGNFRRAVLPVSTLREIAADRTQRDDALCRTCRSQIKRIASADTVSLLTETMHSNESEIRTAVSRILTNLGPACAEQLLDILQRSTIARERLRILSIIADMGPSVAPAVVQRIRQQGPWYYLRNLVRLLGEIGNETHLDALTPLLNHDDFRVKWEVLGSIFKIGGQQRGTILLEQLPVAEDRLKLQVVSLLGGLRYRNAVPALIHLLEKRSYRKSRNSAPLQVKACTALGKIGSSLAIPILSEISRGRRASVFKSYDPAVRSAAAAALNTLQQSLKNSAR